SGRLPPGDFLHRRARLLQHGAAHAERVRAATWEVDMRGAIVDLVARAVVAGRDASGNAQQTERVQAIIHGLYRIRRPARIIFGKPPTDGERHRPGRNHPVQQVYPAALVEGGEVNRDARLGAQAGDDLDVHHDFHALIELIAPLPWRQGQDLLQGERGRIHGDRVHIRDRALEVLTIGGDVVGNVSPADLRR